MQIVGNTYCLETYPETGGLFIPVFWEKAFSKSQARKTDMAPKKFSMPTKPQR